MGPAYAERTLCTRTTPTGTRQERRRFAVIAVGIVVGLLVLLATGAYLRASGEYRASADPGTSVASRLAAADAAEALWPFSSAFRVRAITLRGLSLVDDGDILGAYDVLHAEYVREAIAGRFVPELVAAHAAVYQTYFDASYRTAHVMHGKEQPNGTIRPEDVQHFPRSTRK